MPITYLGGAFYGLSTEVGAGRAEPFTAGDGVFGNIRFEASRYNSVYGNSTTVQPSAIRTTYIIKF